jgi:hypothetical protein
MAADEAPAARVLVRPLTLERLESAIRASWGRDTCDPSDQDSWSEEHPSTGQCAATAYVVNDLLGGKLLGAEVHHPDGSLQGHHYWNLFEGGLEIDLTAEQFCHGEVVQAPDVMDRIHAAPDPGAEHYLLLKARVVGRLADDASGASAPGD